MIRFFPERKGAIDEPSSQRNLGQLEYRVMKILWARKESSVRDVVERLSPQLAYTTVMTTLDRLFKKRLLERRKSERAFFYSPRLTRDEWERKRAGDLLAGFLAGPHPSPEVFLSSLLDAVGEYDESLLNDLEKKIRAKRRGLARRSQS